VHDHRRLEVWQAGRRFVFDVYELTLGFPDSERFGLTSQLRRASVSIPSNIAEGAGRGGSGRSFAHFLRIAAGSAAEAETQLQLARDVGIGDEALIEAATDQIEAIRKMLWSLERHHAKNP
jgi:four helix bundle protein